MTRSGPIAVALMLVSSLASSQSRPGFTSHFGEPIALVTSAELSQPLAYEALKDGSVVAIEFQSTSVLRIASTGRLI